MKINMCTALIPFISLILIFSGTGSVSAQNTKEYAIKAAFILNFVRFTQWPDNSFLNESDPIKL